MPFLRGFSTQFVTQGVLDGIPGWPVDFRRAYLRIRELEPSIESVLKRAKGFLRRELKGLKRRSPATS